MTPKNLLIIGLLVLTSFFGVSTALAVDYQTMCGGTTKYICIDGRGQGQIYNCTNGLLYNWQHAHACYPERTPGQSCSGLPFYGNFEGHYNYVGCSGDLNCYCDSGNYGSVTCYSDINNDSCASGKLPVTPTPAPTPPACNDNFTMNYSESCNMSTLNISGQSSTHSNASNTVTGPTNCASWNGTSKSCDLTGAGNLTWTHNWQECVVVNGINYCSAQCSKTKAINTNFIGVTCSDINSITPNSLTWGEDNTANINYNYQANSHVDPASERLSMTVNAGAQTPVCSRTAFNGSVSTYNCNVRGPVYPSQIDWKLTWTEQHNNCPGITKSNCSDTFNGLGKAPSGFFSTTGGDVYVGGALKQTRFPSLASDTETFTTYSFSTISPFSLNSSILYQRANATYSCFTGNFGNPRDPYCSKKKFIIPTSYADSNSPNDFRADSWFDYIYGSTQNSTLFTTSGSSTYNAGDYQDGQVVYLANSFTIPANSSCKQKNIFLIAGDLNINPDFILANQNAACLFVVKGTTTVLTYPTARPATTQDKIMAFIITGGFKSNSKVAGDNALKIQGGLITQVGTVFGRNVNTKNQLLRSQPSELIDYEGARYIEAFRNLLHSPAELKIREVGYQSTVLN